MMLADRVLVRTLQEAVDLAVGVMVKLDLPYTEVVGGALARSLRYLVDRFLRQLQVVVKIHEPRHAVPPSSASLPATMHRRDSTVHPRKDLLRSPARLLPSKAATSMWMLSQVNLGTIPTPAAAVSRHGCSQCPVLPLPVDLGWGARTSGDLISPRP